MLFCVGSILLLRKILTCQLCNYTRKSDNSYQVRYCHEAVKGVGNSPNQLKLDYRTDEDHSDIEDIVIFISLSAEEEFNAAAAVKCPTENGGDSKHCNRNSHKDTGHTVAHYRCECGGGKLSTCTDTVGDGDTAGENGKCCEGADNDGINEDLEYTVKTLLYRRIGIGRGVCKRSRAETCLVRKYWNVTSRVDIDRYRKTVRTWRRLYKQKGANVFMKDSTPRKKASQSNVPELTSTTKSSEYDLAALLAENEYLRMENMYLKKLRALILKEEQEKRARRKSSQN